MLVLDTNVISEALRPEPDVRVKAWLEAQPPASVFTTAVSQAEILYGIAILPKGRRQSVLLTAAVLMFEEDFRGRVLPFDSEAATIYASLASTRRQGGLPISFADAQIAAVTQSRGGRLATRNVRDFADCGIEIVNPWDM
jgi:predicted nucleic acid-binding protein